MSKIIKSLIIQFFALVLFFTTQGFTKSLPPGSGEGDIPANVLILLDKSGSMGWGTYKGVASYYPGHIAVGSATDDGGKNVFYNPMWGWYDKKSISYDNNQKWKWKKKSPCTYNSDTVVGEYYDGYFYFVNKKGQFCKIKESNGQVTKIKTYSTKKHTIWAGDIYNQYLFLVDRKNRSIIKRDLQNGTEKICSYSNKNNQLGGHLGDWQVYYSGFTINKNFSYMVFYKYDYWNKKNSGFYKYNLNSNVMSTCESETPSQHLKYDVGGYYNIRAFEASSVNNDHIYAVNYSSHSLIRYDLSGSTISSSEVKTIGKKGSLTSTYDPSSDSEVRFNYPMGIAVDKSNNRVYVADTYNNTIQVFSEENDGFDYVRKIGGRIYKTRMMGAHEAIKAITTDANLTSGVHFGFAYWSAQGGIWYAPNYYSKYGWKSCISQKAALMKKYTWLSSSHWIFSTSAKYMCQDRGGPYGYSSWDKSKKEAVPCNANNCLKVKIDKFGAARTAKVITSVNPGGGTDAKIFTKIALDYFSHNTDSPRDANLKCQVNYIIVIGDGDWGNHSAALKNIKTLKNSYGVKTITIAYGSGINAGGMKRFREAAIAGGTKDVIKAKDAQTLKSAISAEINRIIAEKVSFTAPAITATVEEGGSLMQAQFNYVQNQEWKGSLKKTKLNSKGVATKVEWEARKVMPVPKSRKIWTQLDSKADYVKQKYNNVVTANRDKLYNMFVLYGSSIQDYHSQTPVVAGTVGTSRCKKVSTVQDGIDDDTDGLINFLRGQDYFDYDGDCNLTETRKDSSGNNAYLGDIYHSEMIVVGAPNAETSFTSDREEAYFRNLKGYGPWAKGLKDRDKVIYVGANDGMLHAFSYASGEELWAFIPPLLLPKIPLMMNVSLNQSSPAKGGSNAIYGVDGSPVQHDIYMKVPWEKTPNWHTVLIAPFGRGGNGFSVLVITEPLKPRHLFTVFNDIIQHKVYITDSMGDTTPYPYVARSYSLQQTEEAQAVQTNYNDDNSVDGNCDDTKTTSCYLSKTYTIENFPVSGLTEKDFTITVNGVQDTGFNITNTSNSLTINFSNFVGYQANSNLGPATDSVGIYLNQGSAALGVQAPNAHYDYSQLGETWSAPRVLRIPNDGATDTNVYDDHYVAVMGAGFGAKYEGVGSGVYVINLADPDKPGKIEKFISIEDNNNNDIVNSVPGDPVVITADNVKGYAKYRGAIVYVSDLEGKITKINLTDLAETNLALYDHYTLFNVKTTMSQGRLMYHSMDSAIGKDTKNLWLFAGTGDYENLTDTSKLVSNILLGIEDRTFPEFKKPIVPVNTVPTINDLTNCNDTSKDTNKKSVNCPWKAPPGTPYKMGWYVKLDKQKKVTASPTVAGGMVYFPIFAPPQGSDKCKSGTATICAVDDECGTNFSSLLGDHAKDDECHYVGEGILSRIVTYAGKLFANIAGKSDEGKDLISKSAIGVEVDITRGTWRESF